VLPQLRKIEDVYGERVAVVGVHSGKFTAERVTSHIRDASLRLGALHPIINDRQFRLWRAYAVQAWPTLVAIDPRGYVVGVHAGEFLAEDLFPFIDRILANAATDEAARVHFEPDVPTRGATSLKYPARIAIQDRDVAISDSGNSRVLLGVLSDDGLSIRIRREVQSGLVNPQGVVLDGDHAYVADPGTHRIEIIDIHTGALRHFSGIGRQARTHADVDAGALSSPWDIALHDGSLFVAMAGMHQIWRVDAATGAAAVHSGSGAEELHDGPHASAALAQPMGLAIDGDALLFCDSESSAVRTSAIDRAGGVHTLVGTGLFDFGDADGIGDDVRLQHPQDIVRLADGRLLVADSYNGALKWLNRERREVTTWIRDLAEPSGLAASASHVYVVETNAHRILAVAIDSGEQRIVDIVLPSAT
jgi:hypothetical protein